MLVVEIQGWSHIRRLKLVIMTNFGSLPTSNTFGRSRIASDPLWKWLISFSCLNRDHQASKNVERMCLEPDWWRIDSHWTRILVQGKRESVSATCRHCSVMKAPTAAVKWLIGNFLLVQHSEWFCFHQVQAKKVREKRGWTKVLHHPPSSGRQVLLAHSFSAFLPPVDRQIQHPDKGALSLPRTGFSHQLLGRQTTKPILFLFFLCTYTQADRQNTCEQQNGAQLGSTFAKTLAGHDFLKIVFL